jgi:hypothetical protein
MVIVPMPIVLIVSLLLAAAGAIVPAEPLRSSARPAVTVVRLPAGGIQPQAAADERGVVHVVYFSGTASGGDLFYARFDGAVFSAPVRVNSVAGSAIATGSVRGARLALGRNGRVHVSWNGSTPVGAEGSKLTPMWYARSNADGTAFEQQRDVSVVTKHIDGGGAIAADRAGNVWVAWHAQGNQEGEAHRTVYIARSHDDGATFGAAQPLPLETGACGCCGMQAISIQRNRIDLLYRAATEGIHRDAMAVSVSDADGPETHPLRLPQGRWELRQCPMSTFSLGTNIKGVLAAAWQTEDQIYVMDIAGDGAPLVGTPVGMSGAGTNRKHPSVAVNAAGIHLVAWTEGTAWNRGGTVAWELFAPDGKPIESDTDAGDVPTWGLVAAVAQPDGSFLVVR